MAGQRRLAVQCMPKERPAWPAAGGASPGVEHRAVPPRQAGAPARLTGARLQRPEGGHQEEKAQVKLAAAQQQRALNVPLRDLCAAVPASTRESLFSRNNAKGQLYQLCSRSQHARPVLFCPATGKEKMKRNETKVNERKSNQIKSNQEALT